MRRRADLLTPVAKVSIPVPGQEYFKRHLSTEEIETIVAGYEAVVGITEYSPDSITEIPHP
jgi:hypothetical protein